MEHYVTLFDGLFLPQGLALHASLERHGGRYALWVLCMDETAHRVLERLALPNVRLLSLARLETPELLEKKPGRSRAEYCWTLTPFAPRFVFESDPSVQRVTYVDADLWLRRAPSRVFAELERSGKNVLVTDHAYAPEYDQSHLSGRFCVQFVTFTRGGERVRKWWEERCVEWCHARIEDGKFGDQRYLDDWPERFADDVHVLEDLEALLAPWNVTRFPAAAAVAYHFHGLRLLRRERVLLSAEYRIPPSARETFYVPYLADLRSGLRRLREAGFEPAPQLTDSLLAIWTRMVRARLGRRWEAARRSAIVRIRG